jgi:hypothetical protein
MVGFNSLVISFNLHNIYYLALTYGFNAVANLLTAAGGVTNLYG